MVSKVCFRDAGGLKPSNFISESCSTLSGKFPSKTSLRNLTRAISRCVLSVRKEGVPACCFVHCSGQRRGLRGAESEKTEETPDLRSPSLWSLWIIVRFLPDIMRNKDCVGFSLGPELCVKSNVA